MRTFSPGDVVVVESPVFILAGAVMEHPRSTSTYSRPQVGDVLTVTRRLASYGGNAYTFKETVYVVDGAGLLPVDDLDTLAEERRLEVGDRVVIESNLLDYATEGGLGGEIIGREGKVTHVDGAHAEACGFYLHRDSLLKVADLPRLAEERAPAPEPAVLPLDWSRVWSFDETTILPAEPVDLDAVHLTATDARRCQALAAAKAILGDDADIFDVIRAARFIIGGKR